MDERKKEPRLRIFLRVSKEFILDFFWAVKTTPNAMVEWARDARAPYAETVPDGDKKLGLVMSIAGLAFILIVISLLASVILNGIL